jgi:hypothetical protein
MKTIEEHMAEYLLGLRRGPWTKQYNRECLAMWRASHGEQVTSKVEKLVKERWKK